MQELHCNLQIYRKNEDNVNLKIPCMVLIQANIYNYNMGDRNEKWVLFATNVLPKLSKSAFFSNLLDRFQKKLVALHIVI